MFLNKLYGITEIIKTIQSKYLLLVFFTSLCGQINILDLVSRYDLDGTERKYLLKKEEPYTGEVYYKYNNGQFEFKGMLTDGIQDRHWIWYYENGVKKQEGFFNNLYQDSIWTYWYPSGKIKQEGEYLGGLKRGT